MIISSAVAAAAMRAGEIQKLRKSMYTDRQRRLQELLKAIRIEAGLTQRQLGDLLKTDHSRISDYEHGQRRMDLVELETYCVALGLTLSAFVLRFEIPD